MFPMPASFPPLPPLRLPPQWLCYTFLQAYWDMMFLFSAPVTTRIKLLYHFPSGGWQGAESLVLAWGRRKRKSQTITEGYTGGFFLSLRQWVTAINYSSFLLANHFEKIKKRFWANFIWVCNLERWLRQIESLTSEPEHLVSVSPCYQYSYAPEGGLYPMCNGQWWLCLPDLWEGTGYSKFC